MEKPSTAHRNRRGKYGKFVIPGQEDIANQALTKDFKSVLDVGAGNLCASLAFAQHGIDTHATVNHPEHYDVLDFDEKITFHQDVNIENFELPGQTFDAVWCEHVVEHTMNPRLAIQSMRNLLNDDGWLFLSVPPFKHQVVGGHVSIGWNIGVLMYFLLLSGFDVKNGNFSWHGYNVTAFVRKTPKVKFDIVSDAGNIERLAPYFPPELQVHQGFDGLLHQVNWQWAVDPKVKQPPEHFIPNYRQRAQRPG